VHTQCKVEGSFVRNIFKPNISVLLLCSRCMHGCMDAWMHCIALHCIALHCIALHCIALHCIALHCISIRLCLQLSIYTLVAKWCLSKLFMRCHFAVLQHRTSLKANTFAGHADLEAQAKRHNVRHAMSAGAFGLLQPKVEQPGDDDASISDGIQVGK